MALLLDIVTTAAILFVVASGLLLIFGVMKLINFAHGAFLTLGAYASLVTTQMGWSPWSALALAVLAGAAVGMVIEVVVVRPLYARPLDAILATWGLGIIIGQVLTLAFGREVQFVESPLKGTVDFLGTQYSAYRLWLVGAAVVVGAGMALLLTHTRFGLVTRAVIMNETLARGLGIHSGVVRFASFCVGTALASLAGALITPLSSVDPNMGIPWLVNAFMLVMVAGSSMGSLALAASLFGAAQVLISIWISPVLGGLTIVVLAAITLRLRPEGLSRG